VLLIQCLVTITLLNGGHYFAQTPASVNLHFESFDSAQSNTLHWQLAKGDRVLASEMVDLKKSQIQLAIPLPHVRTKIGLTLHCQWQQGDRIVNKTQTQIIVWPPSGLSKPLKRFETLQVIVLSSSEAIEHLLKPVGVNVRTLNNLHALGLARPHVLIVDQASDSIEPDSIARRLKQFAESGTQIVVFGKRHLKSFTDIPTMRTKWSTLKALDWQAQHPLLGGLSADDWAGTVPDDKEAMLTALAVDADLPISDWVACHDLSAAQIKAVLVAEQQLGQGRMIYWQLPLGNWQTDPRAAQVIENILDYLATPIRPTRSRHAKELDALRQTQIPQAPIPTIGNY
tara:strand:+ start:220500 stop:221525 length:1026 start_codon:yes stop_codon:yes gene_type:complete